jgi:hypothetical protein
MGARPAEPDAAGCILTHLVTPCMPRYRPDALVLGEWLHAARPRTTERMVSVVREVA